MAFKKPRLGPAERNHLVELLIDKYLGDRDTLAKVFPDIVQHLSTALPSPPSIAPSASPFGLTHLERKHHQSGLEAIFSAGASKGISVENAIAALEHGAALLGDSVTALQVDKAQLLKALKIATGLPLAKQGKPAKRILREGNATKRINIIRGVTLYLTWDNKLLAAEVNPKDLKLREKALGFVGCASDETSSVSEHHDDYLTEAYQHG